MKLNTYFTLLGIGLLLSNLAFAQPANNTCADAIEIPVTNGTCASPPYSNVGATTTGNPPTPSCWSPNSMSHTVWFRFTAVSSSVQVSTNFGYSLTNTQIAVFSGSCGSLTQIACNEDINTAGGLLHTNLQLHGLTVGNTYYIIIDGNGTQTGEFGLCIEEIMPLGPPLPIQDCPTAQFLCNKNTVNVSNGPGGPGLIQEAPSCFGSPGERASWWYTFTVAEPGTLCFTITPTSAVDYDWAFYNTTNGCLGTQMACNWSGTIGANGATGANGVTGAQNGPCINVTAGQTYSILVDRFTSNASAGFALSFGGTATFASPNPSFTNTTVCLGTPTQFTNTTSGSNSYNWSFGDGNTSTQQNPSHTYTTSGTFTASLLVTSNPGGCQNIINNTVVVKPIPTVDAGNNSTICLGQCTTLNGSASVSPSSSSSTFSNNTTVSIPNNNTTGANSSTTVSGVVSPNCTIESVCFTLNHSQHADIGHNGSANAITLTMPNGTVYNSTITPLAAFNGTLAYCIPNSVFAGYSGTLEGTYTLNVKDTRGGGGGTGSITNFTVTTTCSTIAWSPTSGMTNSNTLTPQVCPTSTTTYTLSALQNGCVASDNVQVLITDAIVPNFVQQGPYCVGASAATLPTTSTNGITGTWSPSVISTASAGNTTYTFTPNPGQCATTTVMNVLINALPTLNTSGNVTICSGETTSLSVSGAANYTWSPGASLNSTNQSSVIASPTSTTTYTIVGIDANGCQNTTNVTLELINCGCVVTTSNNGPVCPSGIVNLTASLVENANYNWTGPLNFTSNVQNPSSVQVPTVPGQYSYSVQVTLPDGGFCTSSTLINVLVPQQVNAGDDVSICLNQFTTLNATGTVIINWNDGITNGQIVSPTTTTIYTVNGLDTAGCATQDQITVTVNALPLISAGNDVSVCSGGSVPLIATGGQSYTWSPSTGLNATDLQQVVATPTQSTTYSVTGLDQNGCSNTSSVVVTVTPPPTVSVSDLTICSNTTGELTANPSVFGGDFIWSTGETGQSIFVSTEGNYTVSYNLGGCAPVTDSGQLIFVNASEITINNPSICFGNSTTLVASGAEVYEWSPNTGLNSTTTSTVEVNVDETTIYTLFTVDINGCESENEVTVTVFPLPNLSVNAPSQICSGQTITLNASGATNYTWSPSQFLNTNTGSQVSFSPINTTSNSELISYQLNGTDNNGCSSIISFDINVHPVNQVVAINDTTICEQNSLNINVNNPSNFNSIIWSNGIVNNTSIIPNIGTNNYTVNAVDLNGCQSSDAVTITVIQNPLLIIPNDQTICEGTNISLNATGASTITWNNNVINGVDFAPNSTNIYTVTGTDNFGCTSTANVTITVVPMPEASFEPSTTEGQVVLNVNFINNSLDATNYIWNFGNGATSNVTNTDMASTQFSSVGTYAVTLYAFNGQCIDSITQTINVLPIPPGEVFVPNVFSPNGDELNDLWMIQTKNMESIEVVIVNRWGNVMTTITDINGSWDGKTKSGNDASEGVYFYKYKAKALNGEDFEGQGFLTIIRN
jgi:gliding motility-associated-like protein